MVWWETTNLEVISYHADTVLLQEAVVPSSGFSLCISFRILKADLFPAVRNAKPFLSLIINTIFDLIFVLIVSHGFLQKETRGPPQPLRQRAPPAKMPREAEAHPKLSRRLKGGRTKERKVERKQVKVERHGEREERVYIGCPDRTRGHLRSLPASLELQRLQMFAFLLDQIVTWGVELTVEMLRFCFILC